MSARKLTSIALVLGLAGVILTGSLIGLFYVSMKGVDRKISARVDELLTAIDNGSFSETYKTHTSREFRLSVSPEQYKSIGETVATHLGPIKSKRSQRVGLSHKNGVSFAEVKYHGSFEKGEATILVKVRSQNNQWMIDTIWFNSPLLDGLAATRQCPACKKMSKAEAKFCSECGSPLEE